MVNFESAKFVPFERRGSVRTDLTWCNISYDEATGQGCFLMRFEPGTSSSPHEHVGYEEFIVLAGELEDSDGAIYRKNDLVSLKPGSKHVSVSHMGCTVAVFMRGVFRMLEKDEPVHT